MLYLSRLYWDISRLLGAKFKIVVFAVKLLTVDGLTIKLPLTKVDP